MRNGQLCPISGGSTMGGKSGDSVWVRSTIRILPAASSDTSWIKVSALMALLSRFARPLCVLRDAPDGAPQDEEIARGITMVLILRRKRSFRLEGRTFVIQ